jgi:hypothetical protein
MGLEFVWGLIFYNDFAPLAPGFIRVAGIVIDAAGGLAHRTHCV